MSRLDSVIRRLSAQRDILNSVRRNYQLPDCGMILELGLGNGRTYSHLRELFPARRIIAFDRILAAHPSSIPLAHDLILGEIEQTVQQFAGSDIAMIHVDIGTGHNEKDAETLEWLPHQVDRLLRTGGLAVSDLPLISPGLKPLPLPKNIWKDRYFFYEKS